MTSISGKQSATIPVGLRSTVPRDAAGERRHQLAKEPRYYMLLRRRRGTPMPLRKLLKRCVTHCIHRAAGPRKGGYGGGGAMAIIREFLLRICVWISTLYTPVLECRQACTLATGVRIAASVTLPACAENADLIDARLAILAEGKSDGEDSMNEQVFVFLCFLERVHCVQLGIFSHESCRVDDVESAECKLVSGSVAALSGVHRRMPAHHSQRSLSGQCRQPGV